MSQDLTCLGLGLGLRPCHYDAIIETQPDIDWFEIVSEDFIIDGGPPLYYLDKIRETYPLVMHGVSLSIGSTDPIDQTYLKKLKHLATRIDPRWISDHICWTGVDGVNTHGLLPMPYTQEAIDHIVTRIQQVQDYLGQQILLENISSYVNYEISEMTEWEFISAIAEKADCFILLDINNVYVNAFNHHFNVIDFINGLPKARVKQFHIAGHDNRCTHIIDTHDCDVIDQVWSLYENALNRFGAISTLIERDDNIPNLNAMQQEVKYARSIFNKVCRHYCVSNLMSTSPKLLRTEKTV